MATAMELDDTGSDDRKSTCFHRCLFCLDILGNAKKAVDELCTMRDDSYLPILTQDLQYHSHCLEKVTVFDNGVKALMQSVAAICRTPYALYFEAYYLTMNARALVKMIVDHIRPLLACWTTTYGTAFNAACAYELATEFYCREQQRAMYFADTLLQIQQLCYQYSSSATPTQTQTSTTSSSTSTTTATVNDTTNVLNSFFTAKFNTIAVSFMSGTYPPSNQCRELLAIIDSYQLEASHTKELLTSISNEKLTEIFRPGMVHVQEFGESLLKHTRSILKFFKSFATILNTLVTSRNRANYYQRECIASIGKLSQILGNVFEYKTEFIKHLMDFDDSNYPSIISAVLVPEHLNTRIRVYENTLVRAKSEQQRELKLPEYKFLSDLLKRMCVYQ